MPTRMPTRMKRLVAFLHMASVLLVVFVAGCGPDEPTIGSQTNWLKACHSDADCGSFACFCGTCTRSCETGASCDGLPGASCIGADDAGAVALCGGGTKPSPDLCLPRCPDEGCGPGTSCVAGVCSPTLEPTATVSIDESQQFQSLVGIGAGIAYVNDEVVQHPNKEDLFDAMFVETGLSVIRLRNGYDQQLADLISTEEIVSAARERLGQEPLIIMNSASPPGSLKRNGSSWCEGNPDTCTLASLPDGSFDYGGLANHWRDSLEAYAELGIEPDYISIQNNPNWVPPSGFANEACWFLPTEGSAVVATADGDITVDLPGYAEALNAVVEGLDSLAAPPQIIAPETTHPELVAEYVAELDFANVDAIAHHLYGVDAAALDRAQFIALGELGQAHERPLFQSEMQADALAMMVLMHASFALEGAALFVQNGFIGSANRIEPDDTVLINLTESDFVLGDPYHVMLHYSAHIGPGWVRVGADSDTDDVLVSAWLAPEGDALAVVLTNPGLAEHTVRIAPIEGATASTTTRTVLSGVERSAELGALPPDGIVTLPAQSAVTVGFHF